MALRLTDIAGEGILLLGGARAILLQVAHPAVGRGVTRHSDFAADRLKRLRNTLTYIYVVVYGTDDEVARVTSAVNAAHQHVTGDGYDAADAQLQLWVAATLYESAATLYERIFGPLTPDDAESIYRDYAKLGTALQVPQDAWPPAVDSFQRYWADASEKWCTTPETLVLCDELLGVRNIPAWLRLGMPLVRLVTTGLLTPQLRVMYQLPWSPSRQRRFDFALRVIAVVVPRIPKRIRNWPRDHYLAQFRARSRAEPRA
ncbi:MAG: oxygenase MpaB family protein [Terrimesophilobacter sp.]